jgi:uncharacterized protein YndB with AHSA1/START domain
MMNGDQKRRRGLYLILIFADVLAIFLVAGLSRSKATDTVVGVLVLSLPVLIVLWLLRVLRFRGRNVTAESSNQAQRRRRQSSWSTSNNPAPSEGLPAIRLGGAADHRFERRLEVVRRSARYLLIADVLALVLVVNLGTGNAAEAVTGILVIMFAVLVVVSLVHVVTSKVKGEVTVQAGTERVFALVADPQHWLRRGGWLGRYRNVDAVPAASGGFKGQAELTALGLPGHMRWEMLEYQPPRHVVTFARVTWLGIPSLTMASWSLQAADGGVRVRYEQESRSLGVTPNPARPLIHGLFSQAVNRRLAQLKDEAERQ